MEAPLALANAVDLYAEEIAPETDDVLGSVPPGLVHPALVSAAVEYVRREKS